MTDTSGDGLPEGEPAELTGWLRPAQAGVALAGGARANHIAATLIDLEIRGHLAIEPTAGAEGGPDWLLRRRAAAPRTAGRWRRPRPGPAGEVLRYERALLAALPRREAIRLSQASKTKRWRAAVNKVYRQLNREAIRRGFVRPVPAPQAADQDGGREDRAAGVVAAVRAFRTYLRMLQPSETGERDHFREYLPYAVALGLTPHWAEQFAGLVPPTVGYGYASDDGSNALGAAFVDAACAHVHSAVGHGGSGGWGGHGGGGHGGHGGGHGGGSGGGGGGHH